MRANTVLSVLVAVLCFLPAAGQAARLFQAPLAELARGHIAVVEARAVDKQNGAVTFARITGFSGQSDDSVTVRMDAATLADVNTNDRYVVGYTSVVHHPQRREEKLIDPEGPRVVTLRGFGTAALFAATDDVRALFQAHANNGEPQHHQILVGALVPLLRSPDHRTRTLAAGELFLNEGLRTSIDAEQAYRIGKAAPTLSDELASYLVETLATLPQVDTAAWLPNLARELIGGAGNRYDLASHRPRLVSESVQALTPFVRECDEARLVPLLQSNAPRVVESAIAALELLDPALAAQSVTQTLDAAQWDDSLTAPVRRVLEAYRVSVSISP